MKTQEKASPPYHADHVGSLLRPSGLFEARRNWQAGSLLYDELKQIEDDCVRDAVAMQEAIGLKGITDGDFRRDDWFLDFMYSINGIIRSGEYRVIPFSDGINFDAPVAEVNARLACPQEGILLDAYKFLHSVTSQTPKVCIPAPAMFYSVIESTNIDSSVYSDLDEFWHDLGSSYKKAIEHYGIAGSRYLQIDDVNSANITDPNWQEFWRGRGFEPEHMVEKFIAINNAALNGRHAEMKVVIHMCRGNYQSQWAGQGSYDMVAERYFTQSDVDGFFLEYDDERSGGFGPLRYMPKDKFVMLGIMTSKYPELESKDGLKRRIDEAGKFIDLEQLGISPQCGFASTQEGNKLSQDEQWRKLELLVEVAEEVWGGV